jgi:SIR2-like domain
LEDSKIGTVSETVRLTDLGIDRNLQTVVVLGAGASRGSYCASRIGVAPPLDADFFAQAQRMPAKALMKSDRDLFDFVRSEFGPRELPTLEVFFTQISAVHRFHHEFNIQGRITGKFSTQLGSLLDLVPRVFQQALGDRNCRWHERIAASLNARDAVLSFNYDTLMDRALRLQGQNRWVPQTGYGFDMRKIGAQWVPPPHPGPPVQHPVFLLKPHGSLNWELSASRRKVSLVDEYGPTTANSIVPPTWDKADVREQPWNDVWRTARGVLATARMLVVIGYSVPVTDQLSQALLRADVNNLSALVVVNPDSVGRSRIVDVFSSALMPSTTVIELDTLDEFASYLPRTTQEAAEKSLLDQITEMRSRLNRTTTSVSRLRRSQDQFEGSIEELENQQEELRNDLIELQTIIDEVSDGDRGEIGQEVRRLTDEVSDLDARIDSILS